MRELTQSDFDGHPEKSLKEMTPKEKLEYLSAQIELIKYARENVVRKNNLLEPSSSNIR